MGQTTTAQAAHALFTRFARPRIDGVTGTHRAVLDRGRSVVNPSPTYLLAGIVVAAPAFWFDSGPLAGFILAGLVISYTDMERHYSNPRPHLEAFAVALGLVSLYLTVAPTEEGFLALLAMPFGAPTGVGLDPSVRGEP